MIYVVGGMEENEIMLYNVVLALRDSMHLLFKYVPIHSSHHLVMTVTILTDEVAGNKSTSAQLSRTTILFHWQSMRL